jgi:hypothetical protein
MALKSAGFVLLTELNNDDPTLEMHGPDEDGDFIIEVVDSDLCIYLREQEVRELIMALEQLLPAKTYPVNAANREIFADAVNYPGPF